MMTGPIPRQDARETSDSKGSAAHTNTSNAANHKFITKEGLLLIRICKMLKTVLNTILSCYVQVSIIGIKEQSVPVTRNIVDSNPYIHESSSL